MPNQNKGPEGPKRRSILFTAVLWAVMITILINFIAARMGSTNQTEISYTEFIELISSGKVESVKQGSRYYVITLKSEEKLLEEAAQRERALEEGTQDDLQDEDTQAEAAQEETTGGTIPTLEDLLSGNVPTTNPGESAQPSSREEIITAPVSSFLMSTTVQPLMDEHGVETWYEIQQEQNMLLSILVSYLLPMVLIMALFFFFMRRMGSGMGGMGGVGKANAKVYMERSTGVTFADVAGQDEAKESLQEIIDFLHNPRKYTEIGAKLPKGALLVGSPGTGKTLMAKAVAGEASVPFFSISGSDFVEMFVGVGASRVRDLFKEAAKVAPCIIFIDEIDTIGKSRDNRMGGNDEREQTLNQLLAELDGFDPTKGVIVLAATNRPEVLDKALLRPGRFDRRITVDRPNLAGRLATLQVHTKKIRLAEDVDLNKLAQATAGCVGADLANLVNEAALRAVRMGRQAVNQRDLLRSFEMVIAGAEKKGTVLTDKEKKLIAYHEVGHALVSVLQSNQDPVSKITIVPHTQGALGYTMHTPEEERFLMDRDELYGRIRVLLAGRCAEEVVFQTKTTGAANDIERATDLARKMVTMYGMSDKFGMMALATVQNQYLDGSMGLTCAQDTAAHIDEEIRSIIDQCHDEVIVMLEENREKLNEISEYLLKKENITGAELSAIMEGRDPEEAAEPEEEVLQKEWIPPRHRPKPQPEEGPEDESLDDFPDPGRPAIPTPPKRDENEPPPDIF